MLILGLDAYFSDAYSIKGYDELTALNKPFDLTEVGPQTTEGSLDYSSFTYAVKQKYPQTHLFLSLG